MGLDLRIAPEDEKFRRELSAWLASEVPRHGATPPMEEYAARRAYETSWQRKLFDAGYAGLHWPSEYGGRNLSLTQQLIYHEEVARANAPDIGMNFVGLMHGGPTLIVEGSPEQKSQHLPAILRGEEVWCQGFSEPSAGSDLANLRTRAVRDGDHYLVTGQKIWTSYAHQADYCELLVRTNPDVPKHKGISWLILPMRSPGIEVRPLKTVTGEGEFSEVFLENVRVPIANRVGAEDDGWRVTNVTLRFERGTAFSGRIYQLQVTLNALRRAADRITRGDARSWDDAQLRREAGKLQAELDSLSALLKLSISEAEATGVPGLGSSALKLAFTHVYQGIGELGVRVLGRAGLSLADFFDTPVKNIEMRFFYSLSIAIAAGSSQIQRNIIAERMQGLPKDR
jgi:hypothetical protein